MLFDLHDYSVISNGTILTGIRGSSDNAGPSFHNEALINILLMISGYILFLLIQHIPLFSGGTLALPDGHLLSIVLFQFIPIFTIVAGQATHFAY
ncbi:hypothetical protein KKA14_06710 [bacterium]|nr:hypothetical protein [bacterium]